MVSTRFWDVSFDGLVDRWGLSAGDAGVASGVPGGGSGGALLRRDRIILLLHIDAMLAAAIGEADVPSWVRSVNPACGCRRPLDHVLGSLSELRRLHDLVLAEAGA